MSEKGMSTWLPIRSPGTELQAAVSQMWVLGSELDSSAIDPFLQPKD